MDVDVASRGTGCGEAVSKSMNPVAAIGGAIG
jgi:hypothetical protein